MNGDKVGRQRKFAKVVAVIPNMIREISFDDYGSYHVDL